MIQFHSLTHSCPVLPTPAGEEAVISPLYIHGSFIVYLTICVWVNIWTLYSVPLGCGSVLVPVPNCLDNCGFVVELEVGKRDPPCFIRPSQDYFGYLGSFVVPYEFLNYLFQFIEECCWYFNRYCTESLDWFRQDGHFNNINSSYPRAWDEFPFISILFNFS